MQVIERVLAGFLKTPHGPKLQQPLFTGRRKGCKERMVTECGHGVWRHVALSPASTRPELYPGWASLSLLEVSFPPSMKW